MVWKMVRSLVRPLWKPVVDATVHQTRIELKLRRMERGEKALAPRHPTEQKAFEEAQKDETVKKDLETKHEKLARNLEQITIQSHDPAPSSTTTTSDGERPFPTHASDIQMPLGGDAGHEYGYYEPPSERLEPGKLTLREALEFLRIRATVETAEEGEANVEEGARQALRAELASHPTASRVPAEKLDLIWDYYRPFDAKRKRKQYVVRQRDLDDLVEAIEDYPSKKMMSFSKINDALREKIQKQRTITDEDAKKDPAGEQQREFIDTLRHKHEERRQMLAKRLEELKRLDAEVKAEKPERGDDGVAKEAASPPPDSAATAKKGGAT